MIKQICGKLYAIGGTPEEIIPLHWAFYNFNVIFKDEWRQRKGKKGKWVMTEYKEPLNLGNPNNFLYFLISEKDFINGRIKIICNTNFAKSEYKGKKKGAMSLIIERVKNEWKNIKQETFLEYGQGDFDEC